MGSGNLGKLIRASRGPVLLMTLGGLLAVNQFTGFSFDQTFPILIIVFGMMWLLERMAPRGIDAAQQAAAGVANVGTVPEARPFPEPELAYDPLREVHRRVYGTDVPPPATMRPPLLDPRDLPTAEHPSRQAQQRNPEIIKGGPPV